MEKDDGYGKSLFSIKLMKFLEDKMKESKELEVVRRVIYESIKSHKDSCYCTPKGLCDNCKCKDAIITLSKEIEKELKD